MRAIALVALVLAAAATGVAARPPVGAAAAGRRHLAALETSTQAPARNVTTRGITDCLFEDIENASTAGNGCMHGRYCGKGCSGLVDGEDFKASPIDELDRACFFHDKCFSGGDTKTCRECHCNAQLGAVATQIWNAGNEAEGCGCGLFQNRCSEMVMEAGSVWGWIDLFTYSDNCASDCSDAPTGDQCSANVAYETDLYGGDIRDVPVADWTECCDVCREDSDCRAWTYTNGGCWLKDGTGWSQEAREGLISGWW